MSQLATERVHLEKADDRIAGGERRIKAQANLVERLRAAAHDTVEAERLLGNLQDALVNWNEHRDEIIREIARLEQALPS